MYNSEEKKAFGCAVAAFCLWAVFILGWWAFIIWVIYKLVTWLTSQTL